MATLQTEITNAFEEIASTSSSTPTKKAVYDVFINHRGIDVKKTLASSIYNTLHRMGFRVFLDEEELELGDNIPAEIEDAMRTSFLHIAIFSPNYAQSPWCLAELSYMLKTGTRIIPVFYDVDPSDLRWAAKEKGTYADAFSEHEAKNYYSPEKLKDWKMALQQVSNRSGSILKKDDDEGMLLKSIANCVMKYLKKVSVPLEVARHPVGLREAVQDFERCALQSSQNVQIIGIVGMGGSGKTTLAKELYNKKSSSIARCSFLFDVRDATSKKLLHNKQKTLLEDLKLEHSSFDNVEKGKQILTSSLKSLCFLLVLDDVDHPDQLDALLPVRDSLASGSLIIVTSRERGVLESWGITCIYNMKLLACDHARKLLCWHAFLQESPLEGFEALVEKFVDVCSGLPLSLKVFGGQLYRKPKVYWESQLDKISRLLPNDINERLKISYDALDGEEKEMFLDTACFFIGKEKSLAIAVWDGCGWSGLHSWETLLNKCLVELDEKNCIKMHDHLRDLGKEIAMTQSPYRLWLPEHITKTQEQAKERLQIRGIIAETTEFYKDSTSPCSPHHQTPFKMFMKLLEFYWAYFSQEGIRAETFEFHEDSTSPFKKCMELVSSSSREFSLPGQLKLLVVRENYFREEFATVSTGLVWLSWVGLQLRTLPSWLSLKNLSVLELLETEMLEELWRDNDELPLKLRELIITGGERFVSFPRSIGRLKYLKKIVLRPSHGHLYPTSMVRVRLPEEFCRLQSLEHLTLIWCRKLRSLPSRFGNLTNLRHLDLSLCAQLMTLPVSFKQLIHLEYINLEGCSELTFTSENADIVENMTELEMLNLSDCRKLQELPLLTNQRSLRELHVMQTGSLRELPSNIGELSKLEVLRIASHLLTSLPTSIGNLSSLTHLEIGWCRKLESLPESIGNLSSLTRLTITGCEMVESLPESMGNLHLLQNLHIWWTGIKSLPKALAQLSNLQDLSINGCPIKELDFESGSSSLLYNLKSISLEMVDVSRISISQQCCPSLETLRLVNNEHLTDIQTLPISLKVVRLTNCKMLKSISGICGLLNLQELVIDECGKLDELPSFAKLVSLETLRAGDTTWKMAAIQSWEHMERLRRVEFKLAACDISAIEHCLQTIKKWPSETIVWGRTEDDVDSLLKLFTFDTDFSLVDSCVHDKTVYGRVRLRSGQRRSSNAAVMLCFIINCFSECTELISVEKDGMDITSSKMRIGKGKWVWIGVSTDASCLMGEEYSLDTRYYTEMFSDVAGMLVMGKQERVVEGFYKLLVHLGKSIEV